MDQTQNGEAQTPTKQEPMTTARLVGEVVHAFTAHGMAVEKDLEQAQQGARNLGLQLRMAHRSMDEGERRIGELTDAGVYAVVMLEEAIRILGNGRPQDTHHSPEQWYDERSTLVQQWSEWDMPAALRPQPAQTDAEPTEAVQGTWTGPTCGEQCQHAPDGGNHPSAPPAG